MIIERTLFPAAILMLPLLVSCKTLNTVSAEQAENIPTPKAEAPAQAEPTPAAASVSETAAVVPSESAQSDSVQKSSQTDAPTAKPAQESSKPRKSNPNDPRNIVYLGSDGKMAGTGDPNQVVSEAFKLGKGASAAALTAPGLPKDKFGLIDWIAMVNRDIIKPVGSLEPNASDEPPFEMNVVIKAKGDFVKDVLFQHKTHTYWLACENCHTGIFQMAAGQNNMTMAGISQGQWCGRCHGKVSFPLTDCIRCHSQAKQTVKNGS